MIFKIYEFDMDYGITTNIFNKEFESIEVTE